MKIHLLFFVLACSLYSLGQPNIKGKIKEAQQNLSSATVFLLTPDSVVVKQAVTDTIGQFVFGDVLPGRYIVSASLVGYSRFLSQPFSVNKKDIVLPDILLETVTSELSGVVVKAKKPLFEQQADRLIVNVQSSVASSGNTILEVLQKSPGITINRQDNSITMNGKSGVRVMINDKLMQLPLDVVVQMLDGMSASNVEKIELITTPPAKYDAEGNAGIIRIVLKRNENVGTNGSFGLTVGYRWAETLGGNFNFNHRNKNLAFFLDYSVTRNNNLHIFKMTSRSLDSGFLQTVSDYSHRENVTTQQNLNSGIEWNLSKNTLLNISFTGYRRNWEMNAVNYDNNHAAPDSTLITNMNITELNVWQSATAGVGLQTKMNLRNEINFNIDYLYYHNDNPSGYDDTLLFKQRNTSEISKIDLRKNTPIRFIVAKADYKYSYSSSFLLEAGIKAVTSNLDNNILVQRLVNNVWVTDPFFTSFSTLNEDAGAIYASAKWQAGKEWQVNGGLRYEYTHTSISTPARRDLINRKYGYLFPSFLLKKDIDKKKNVQFSYTRRITRPTYNDIAPFVFFWGPNTFSAGNTSLYPAISDAIKSGYQANHWIISLQWSHSKNEIAFLQPEKDSQFNNLIYRSQNLKYLNTLGLTNSWSFNIAAWWKIQANIIAQYQVAQTAHLKNNVKLYTRGANVNVINSVILPKDFSIEISGTYQSRLLAGISEYLPVETLNVGIQKKFGEKGTLRLAMDDILYANYWKIKTYIPEDNLDSYFFYDFHNQFVRLTFTRNFGNNKLRSVKLKSGSEEERSRITN